MLRAGIAAAAVVERRRVAVLDARAGAALPIIERG